MNILLKILKTLFFLILCAGLFAVFAYFHPTKETMNCNGNYECNVVHDYFNLYQYNNTFTLNPKSEISNIKQTPWWNFKGSSFMHLTYDGKKPFIYFFQEEGEDKYYEILFNEEKVNFNKYLKNPTTGYSIESMAERSYILYILLTIFVICPLFFKIFLNKYLGINQTEKKREQKPKSENTEKKSKEQTREKENKQTAKIIKKPESRFSKKPAQKFNKKPIVKKPEIKKTDDKKQEKKTENKPDKKTVEKDNKIPKRNYKKPPFKKP